MAERQPHESSPLKGCAVESEPILLVERTGLGTLSLRGSGPAFMAATGDSLGVPLPAEPNTTSACGRALALWLGPDEWLVRLPVTDVGPRLAALRRNLAGRRASVVDVSDRDCIIRISGDAARDILAAGCPLDLHPRVFRPGACARSHCCRIPILVDRVDEGSTFDLQTPRSYAGDLWEFLAEASSEFRYMRS